MEILQEAAKQILTGAGIAGFVLFLVVLGLAYFIIVQRREISDTRGELKECWTNYSSLLKDNATLITKMIEVLDELKDKVK